MKQEAFIALEETMGAALHKPVQAVAARAVQEIHRHLEAGSPILAQDAVQLIALNGALDQAMPRLRTLATSCLLFGAAGLAPLGDTVFERGGDTHEPIQALLDHLRIMIEHDGADEMRWSANSVVQVEQFSDQPIFSLFKAEDVSLADRLNAAVNGTGKAVVDIAANMTTSRLVAFGFLAQAQHSGIESYQISEVLDKRTCPVCRFMHGKTFQVGDEMSRLRQTFLTQNPQELRDLAPWPKQSKASLESLFTRHPKQLQNDGLGSPPYHPGCRGMLVKTGTVQQDVGVQQPGFDIAELLAKFKLAKPKPTPKPKLPKSIPLAVKASYQLIIESIPDGELRDAAQALFEAGNEASLRDLLKENGFL